MSKCRLSSSNSLTDNELLTFSIDKIFPTVMDIYNNPGYRNSNGDIIPTKIRLATIQFIKDLSKQYYKSEYIKIELLFNYFFNSEVGLLFKDILPSLKILDILNSKESAQTINDQMFIDLIELDESETDQVDYFLHKAYNQAEEPKEQLQFKMNNIVLNCFMIDRENGEIIENIEQANEKVKNAKIKLLKEIQEYFKINNINESFTSNTDFIDPDEVIRKFSSQINKYLQPGLLTGTQLLELYNNSLGDSNTLKLNKAKITAYGSWLALQYFDNFIKMAVGKAIEINLNSKERYSFANKGDTQTSNAYKDRDLLEEIDKFTQTLINTSPILNYQSNEPSETGYLNFNDFGYITSKIKKLGNSKTKIDLNNLNHDNFTNIEQEIIDTQPFDAIINNIRLNPQLYLPLIYKILTSTNNNGLNVIDSFKEFGRLDKLLLWSIYKNIFDSNWGGMTGRHSILSIQNKYPQSKNYFASICSTSDYIFSNEFLQYVDEDGIIKVRTLRDSSINDIYYELKNIINVNLYIKTIDDLKTNYDIKEITNQNQFSGIIFKITDNLGVSIKNFGVDITFYDSNNNIISILELDKYYDDDKVNKFIDDILGFNLQNNLLFKNTYQEFITQNGEFKSTYMHNLLTLSGSVLFNSYFDKSKLNNIEKKSEKINVINNYFNDETKRPEFNQDLFNMDMLSPTKVTMLNEIAFALGASRGVNSSRQVKNSENNNLSTQVLSRLYDNLQNQYELKIRIYKTLNDKREELSKLQNNMLDNNRKDVLEKQILTLEKHYNLLDSKIKPAASNFDLVTNKNLLVDYLISSEIKGQNTNKELVDMSVSEAFESSFLHNFILGFCDKSNLPKNSKFGDGVVGFLPSINSDKSLVGTMVLDLNLNIPFKHIKYKEANNDTLLQQINITFSQFYNTMYDNINETFKKLEEFHKSLYPKLTFDYKNHFAQFNKLVYEYTRGNYSSLEFLNKLCLDYNKKNPNNPIALIDLIHYVKDGNKIKANNLLFEFINRFDNYGKSKEFFDYKNSEILRDLLTSNFEVNFYLNEKIKQPELLYLLKEHSDWINKSGKMKLATVTINGKIFDISSKIDLLPIERELTLLEMKKNNQSVDEKELLKAYNNKPNDYKNKYGYNNLIDKPHILSKYNLQLHPMLEKYNLMDYLFTLLFLLSSVGTLLAHPAKVKYETKTIWMPESYYDDNEEILLSDYYINFNEELITEVLNIIYLQTDNLNQNLVINDYNTLNVNLFYKKYKDKIFNTDHGIITRIFDEYIKKANIRNKHLILTDPLLLKIFNNFDYIQKPDSDIENFPNENEINGILTENYIQKFLNNDVYQLYLNISNEEALKFAAQNKRNVSLTATMKQFQLNQKNGVTTYYNAAILDDIVELLFTIDGNIHETVPLDGSTFIDPFTAYLENFSLNESKVGMIKKPFIHFYDEATGTGGIIKTAGFPLTNSTMRKFKVHRNLMQAMTDKVWLNQNGNEYNEDITKDGTINIDEFYFKEKGKFYVAKILKNTDEVNSYIRIKQECTSDGEPIGDEISETFNNINTNYNLWNLFGGMNSCSFKNGELKKSEESIIQVVNTMNAISYNLDGNYSRLDGANLFYPLKMQDIHIAPTIGAIKQGAANINSNSIYTKGGELNFYKIKILQAGIQLDKEHHADLSDVSLPTQIISASAAMGYNPKQLKNLYKALYTITSLNIKDFKEGLNDIFLKGESLNDVYENAEKFDQALTECIVRNLLTGSINEGDMLRAMTTEVIEKARNGELYTFNDIAHVPISDPKIFKKVSTTLASSLTKLGIKVKMDGILSILCPTSEIVKIYKFTDENGINRELTLEQLEEFYREDTETALSKALELLEELDLDDLTNFEIGNKYIITDNNGNLTIVNIKFPHDYTSNVINTIKLNGKYCEEYIIGYLFLKGNILKGSIQSIKKYVKDGNELNTMNYIFKDTKGDKYQMWDIDFILDLFKLIQANKEFDIQTQINNYKLIISNYNSLDNYNKNVLLFLRTHESYKFVSDINQISLSPEYELELLKRYTNRIYLNILFALSKNNEINPSIKVNGELITIDKSSIEYKPYEIVMPKTFIEEFDLEEDANLNEIVNDSDYFYKKLKNNFKTKVLDEKTYDVELKNINGNHIYLKDVTNLGTEWSQGLQKVNIHKKEIDGKLWRMDPITSKKMYILSSNEDEVYKIPGTNVEILAYKIQQSTNDNKSKHPLVFYLNNFKYNSIHISDAIDNINLYLDIINKSNNKTAKSWLKIFKNESSKLDKESNLNNINANSFTNGTSILVENKTAKEINQDVNDFEQLPFRLQNSLKQQCKEKYVSFLKSLEIIAGRIPSQNMQSFMPMKVVAYDDDNVNTAYVSAMQFFLQGSDLDIDAVSLLTYSFDKKGLFYSWSPEFNLNSEKLLNESLKLPFPTGNKLNSDNIIQDSNSELSDIINSFKNIVEEKLNYLNSYENYLNYIDLDDIIRKDVEKLAKEKGIAVQDLKTQLEEDYKNLLLNTIDKWKNDKTNKNKILLVSDHILAKEKIFNNEITIPDENTFVLRWVNRNPNKTNNNIQLLENEARTYYNNLITEYYSPNVKIENKYVIEIENEAILFDEPQVKFYSPTMGKTYLVNLENKLIKELQYFTKILEYIELNKGNLILDPLLPDNFIKYLTNRVDSHNTFLSKLNSNDAIGAAKNQLMNSVISIASDSANLIEAHSGIDEITKKEKTLANKSKISIFQKYNTPGNVVNKFKAIEEASLGKDDIGICATGLKLFFAATLCLNQNLNNNKIPEQELYKFITFSPVNIGGRIFKSLANIRANDLTKFNKQSELVAELKLKGFDEDASNILSALLSLSVDNAKDLCLAKINANKNMIGMYIYGVAIGMDFEVLNQIIASDLGFTVAELMLSNEFTRKKGKSSVLEALLYLKNGPSYSDLSSYDYDLKDDDGILKNLNTLEHLELKLKKIWEEKYLNDDTKKENFPGIGGFVTDLINNSNSLEECLNILTTIDSPSSEKIFTIKFNQLIDYLKEFTQKSYLLKNVEYKSKYGNSNLLFDLARLADGAHELKLTGQFLTLNQLIKTDSSEFMDFISNIENCVIDRVNVKKQVNEIITNEIKIQKAPMSISFKNFAQAYFNKDSDSNQYDTIIAYYDEHAKTCLNPLLILTDVDNYKGYFESLVAHYFGMYTHSIKFRTMETLGKNFIAFNKIKNKKEKQQVYKGVEYFVDDYIINSYLQHKTIKLPKNSTIITQTNNKPCEDKFNITLGNKYSNQTFVKFFEELVLPKLRNKFPDNSFIQDLTPKVNVDFLTQERYIALSIPINMFKKSGNERSIFRRYKDDVTKLSGHTIDVNGENYSIIELLNYYNLILYKGKVNKNSLTGVFENIFNHDTFKDYQSYYAYFEKDINFTTNNPIDLQIGISNAVFELYVIPISNPWRSSAKKIKYKNSETDKLLFLEIPEKDNENNNSDLDYIDDIDDLYQEYAEYDEYYSNNISYGKYEISKSDNFIELNPNINIIMVLKDGKYHEVKDIKYTDKGHLKSFKIGEEEITLTRAVSIKKINKELDKSELIDKIQSILDQKNCN